MVRPAASMRGAIMRDRARTDGDEGCLLTPRPAFAKSFDGSASPGLVLRSSPERRRRERELLRRRGTPRSGAHAERSGASHALTPPLSRGEGVLVAARAANGRHAAA